MTGARDLELAAVRKLAEEMARGRSERLSTGHLLAAVASAPGNASELLRERHLSAEVLLKAARVFTDDQPDAVTRALQRARDLAARSPCREAHGAHLLFALCQERATAAYRAVIHCGSDVSKLRAASMQVALGLVGARRTTAPAQLTLPRGTAAPRVVAVPPSSVVPPSPSHVGTTRTLSNVAVRQRRPRSVAPSMAVANPVEQLELDPKRFPVLSTVGRNLTLAASRGELDPVFGREDEIDRHLTFSPSDAATVRASSVQRG